MPYAGCASGATAVCQVGMNDISRPDAPEGADLLGSVSVLNLNLFCAMCASTKL
jgi:hypothetical protein